ncbi:hypothetical protein [Cohnella sp. JJ-181]|uniref:hypothetical protein n=1 Tax=Cohnella rhizoplanae TaxID=2974897 RepID=UPI0022FF630E|nr:hypothetical protein [Cohnella sp. JJ-181]CAI6084987.1 hypothetical protein COHCIP112018_04521 [Cohnella sp. JJ-181]
MLHAGIAVLVLTYGTIVGVISMRRKRGRDALWLVLLCCLTSLYELPHIGANMLTVEKAHKLVYGPIARTVMSKLGIGD